MGGKGSRFALSSQCETSPLYTQRAGHDVRLLVVTRFIRLHPGAQKGNAANYWSLFEPHYKQNLSANPKRTAKSSSYIRCFAPELCSNYFLFSVRLILKELLTVHRSHRIEPESRVTNIFLKKFSEIFGNFLPIPVFMWRLGVFTRVINPVAHDFASYYVKVLCVRFGKVPSVSA